MNRLTVNFIGVLAATIAALSFQQSSRAQTPNQSDQSVTIFQYRQVPADKVAEFVYRETTYWSKVAEKAVDAKKMTLWVLLEQVGGHDLPNSPNFLFVNTVPNVDALEDIFNAAVVFPNVPMESISTDGMSTTTSQFFLHDGGNIVEAAGTVRERDFKYLTISYHNSSDAAQFIALERQVLGAVHQDGDGPEADQAAWLDRRVRARASGRRHQVQHGVCRLLPEPSGRADALAARRRLSDRGPREAGQASTEPHEHVDLSDRARRRREIEK